MRLLLLVLAAAATSTHAALPLFDSLIDQINTSSEMMQTAADSSNSTEELSYLHVVDSVLITVIAWLVVVNVSNLKSLFVDDMLHRNLTISPSSYYHAIL